jgi:hypothetical protein
MSTHRGLLLKVEKSSYPKIEAKANLFDQQIKAKANSLLFLRKQKKNRSNPITEANANWLILKFYKERNKNNPLFIAGQDVLFFFRPTITATQRLCSICITPKVAFF